MPSEKQIVDAFDKVAAEIPGYMAAALVDLESGMTLGLKSIRPDFDLAGFAVDQRHGPGSPGQRKLDECLPRTLRTIARFDCERSTHR